MNNPNNISLQIEDHSTNFDFIRLLLASFVLISHSFPLTGEKEILNILTNNQLEFGGLSVNLFFVLSGYFIFISVQKSKSFKNFVWKRILRLFHTLIIQIGLLTTPILTNIYKRIGDISYGVYIYGFIIQQSFMNYFNFNPYYLMSYSLIITSIFAYFSWHLVEKK